MSLSVVLDSSPLGLFVHTKLTDEVEQCQAWLRGLLASGASVFVPEIADYEVRRELLRFGGSKSLIRLNSLRTIPGVEYEPIYTSAMRLPAELWAEARQRGLPTADRFALDGDVILAAQAMLLGRERDDVFIATSNVRHLDQFVDSRLWSAISP